MRQFIFLLATGIVCSAATYFIAHHAKAGAHGAAIVTDDDNGIVRIVIDGRDVARFNAGGFYVRGDIAYSGSITDGLPVEVSHAP